MSLLRLRMTTLPEDLAEFLQQQRKENEEQRFSGSKSIHGLLSGAKGILVAVAAAALVVPMVSRPVPESPATNDAQLQCIGKVRRAFDLVGTIYQLPNDTTRLPDFDLLRSRGSVHLPAAEIPAEVNGIYPYGVLYRGSFLISWPGNYLFRVTSDDGSKLWIDGRVAINNDGQHPPFLVQRRVHLGPGRHSMRLEYFECCGGGAYLAADMCETAAQ